MTHFFPVHSKSLFVNNLEKFFERLLLNSIFIFPCLKSTIFTLLSKSFLSSISCFLIAIFTKSSILFILETKFIILLSFFLLSGIFFLGQSFLFVF